MGDGKSTGGLDRLRSILGRSNAKSPPAEETLQASEPAAPHDDESSAEPAVDSAVRSILDDGASHAERNAEFEEFLDERVLVSRDALGKKEMKVKVIEVTDEHPPSKWKLGDRVKARRILVTIKHLESMKVEEAEFDIEAIEAELAEKRHYTSSNRWIPTSDIKNGYVLKTRHMALISDALALDYIAF